MYMGSNPWQATQEEKKLVAATPTAHCIQLTQEEADTPVWRQVLSNGSLDEDDVEIRDASSVGDMNDLDNDGQGDNFSDLDNEPSNDEGDAHCLQEGLKLRDYQRELAKAVFSGRNGIICAPTGSGKTRVAVHIILEHLKKKPDAKIVFFARTVPLCKQQYQAIKNHLPENYQTKILMITGGSQTNRSLHILLPHYSVIVLTPMILVNHLCGQEPLLREGISAFTMFIFDECHHTREGEPYNNIMYYYLKEKRRARPDHPLPQIVGLTASIGVEKADSLEEAIDNIMSVCGNLDVDHLATVKWHQDELRATVPEPQELPPRQLETRLYEATSRINDIVAVLESRARHYADQANDANVKTLMRSVPSSKKHPEYCQWAVKLRTAAQEADLRDNKRAMRNIIIIADYLQGYHFALDSIDLSQVHDVMKYLRRYFSKYGNNEYRAIQEDNFYQMFKDLEEVVSRQRANNNPNLEILATILRQYVVHNGTDSRGIVFVRTRMLADALVSWLSRCGENDLIALNAKKFTSTNVPEDEGGGRIIMVTADSSNLTKVCNLCKQVTVQSTAVRTIYEKHRVSIDRDLLNKIKILTTEEWQMDELNFVGQAVCLGETEANKICGNGLGYVIKHKGFPFLTLGIKNIVIASDDQQPKTYKQWKKVPYYIQELTNEELMNYATM
ncbi:dicer-like protein 2 [Plakobranchus ocellatus]|uniref:RNA helicase n=1 Tax=Plakobranchus ocellatus TaxID=259542 RepID=A0AAV4AUY8_9GAST|nr:dicer-like protein 2 [Plakobranchus ocellatus]